MKLSRIATSITESVTLELNARTASLRKAGKPVIHLGGGEPVSLAPAGALSKAENLFRSRAVRYGPASGIVELKEGIVDYTKRYYDYDIETSNVIISAGAKQALMVALQAIVDSGDEVAFAAPYWVSYPDMVTLAGGKSKIIEPANGTLIPSLEDFKTHISDRTRVIIINSPSNPSGLMVEKSTIKGLIALCKERDIFLIMDDIYHRLVFSGAEHTNALSLLSESLNDTPVVIINGVSKAYAMTGYRVGWAVAPKSLISLMGKIQGHQTSGPSPLNQFAALGALEGDQLSVERLCKSLEDNSKLLVKELQSVNGVKLTPPTATFYCFADFSAIEPDSSKLAERLLDKALVATVPGVAFGKEGYLRLSTCGSEESIIEGIRRIRWALDPKAGDELEIDGGVLRR